MSVSASASMSVCVNACVGARGDVCVLLCVNTHLCAWEGSSHSGVLITNLAPLWGGNKPSACDALEEHWPPLGLLHYLEH